MSVQISLEKLVETGAHYGHQMRRWNPAMREYMHSVHEGVFVFDLVKTGELLQEALTVLTNASKEGKAILILGTKKQAKEAVMKMAKNTGVFYVTERWLGGTFTNFIQVKRSINKLVEIKKNLKEGIYNNYTKKERLLIARDAEKLERMVGGLVGMEKIPEVIVIIDTHREKSAVIEATRLEVKTIGVVDSNGDARTVDYPVPMNDDASGAVEYVISLFEAAILEGQNRTVEASEETPVKKASKAKKAATKKAPKAVKAKKEVVETK